MQTKPEIIFEEIDGVDGNIGLITLNRPEVLNALNHSMMVALGQQLTVWEDADTIKAVIIRAVAGRAFCAGGDIRAAYAAGQKKDPHMADYFIDEYKVDSAVYHFSKPYIALLDGITMGGGAGISIHGSYRIATPLMTFAMPETGIGFFPDVGASYFLSRLPHHIGIYLGLLGARINYNDCLAIGLVDQVVASDALPEIIQKIADTSLKNNPDAAIAEITRYFSVPVEKSELLLHATEIATCFSKNTVEEIMAALEYYPSAWSEKLANALQLKSPTSLKVTLRLLRLGAKLRFEDCIKMESAVARHLIHSHDFYEGVRAAIIDKDQHPHWQPKSLEEISDADIENFFK